MTEHDKAVRDAALEEAMARILRRCCEDMRKHGHCPHQPCDYYQNALSDVRALKSRPAERFIPASEVRRVLKGLRDHPSSYDGVTAIEAAFRLGVDLDAGTDDGTCHLCPRPKHPGESCYGADEPATLDECACRGRNSRCGDCGGTGLRPARTDGLSGEAAMVADDAVPAPRKDTGGQWTLRVYDRSGILHYEETGAEDDLRQLGAQFLGVKGQKSWACELFDPNDRRVAMCKRGVWKEVKP